MIRKEIGFLKLGTIFLQIVFMLLLIPATQLWTSRLLGGFIINSFSLVVLLLLHAYTYRECSRSRMPKIGHLVGIIATARQVSFPLYLIATLILGFESYVVLANRLPWKLDQLSKPKKVKSN